jgi:hypothetical protein
MAELTQRFQQWADELVDLSGRNDLISFRETKTSTIFPRDEAVKKLLSAESLSIGQIIDLELSESKKAATGLIRDAIEFGDLIRYPMRLRHCSCIHWWSRIQGCQ